MEAHPQVVPRLAAASTQGTVDAVDEADVDDLFQDVARRSKPLIFLPPPEYPVVPCQPTGKIQHKSNQYSIFSVPDQEVLYQALKLRCHADHRLKQKSFLLSSNFRAWLDARVPLGINLADFREAPNPSTRITRRVIALDCEMVGVRFGSPQENRERSELAQLCAVDVLTGQILIDKLVLPSERVVDWRTRFSGVSYPAIKAAEAGGRLLRGWQAARAELLSYIDADTILVGHGLHNDLHVLRLAHSKIVDTALQTAEAVYGDKERFGRIWGLKELAKELTNLTIQAGKRGHDCIEDTLATREIALWCICSPRGLATWSTRARLELEQKRIEREKKLEEQRNKREASEAEKETPTAITQGWPHNALPPLGSSTANSGFPDLT